MLRSKGKGSVGDDLSAATGGKRTTEITIHSRGGGFDSGTKATGSLSVLKDLKPRGALKHVWDPT